MGTHGGQDAIGVAVADRIQAAIAVAGADADLNQTPLCRRAASQAWAPGLGDTIPRRVRVGRGRKTQISPLVDAAADDPG
jgi:hypothetical protein